MPRRTLQIPLEFNNQTFNALIDSGAMGLYMNTRLVQKLKLPLIPLPIPIKVYNVDNTKNIGGKIQHQVNIAYSIYGRKLHSMFLITTLGKQKVILGLPWLEEINPDINWKTHKLSWRTKTIHNIFHLILPSTF